MTIIYLSL